MGFPMQSGTVYSSGWSLDDIDWTKFDASRVDPALLASVKAASLVEYNAPDYVGYLTACCATPAARRLMRSRSGATKKPSMASRWAAGPKSPTPLSIFRPPLRVSRRATSHHISPQDTGHSVRGSRRGEMVARCVVESGTSSFYSAIRDATDEPVLKEVAGRIAADEFRHYKLFFETLQRRMSRICRYGANCSVAVTRVNESDDDELSYAYYCANVPADQEQAIPYSRARFARAYHAKAMTLYRRHHIRKLVQMVAKAVGANPNSGITSAASTLSMACSAHACGAGQSECNRRSGVAVTAYASPSSV